MSDLDYVFDPIRLAALERANILDTPSESGFDDIVELAAHVCEAPVALVSFVSGNRQWFKARLGFESCETDLASSICAYALGEPDLLVISDLAEDHRTKFNPLVLNPPYIRFYAGAPLRTRDGQVLGSLCVIDKEPRPDGLSLRQAKMLRTLAREVMTLLELRQAVAERERAHERDAHLAAIINASSDAILSKNLDGTVTSWNRAAERMFGYAPSEIIGTSIRRLIPSEHQDEEDFLLARIGSGEHIEHYETVRLAKDGRMIPVALSISPVRDAADKIVGASKIIRDISERKKAEEHTRMLVDEVNHRTKNMLSLVQAIARHTASGSPADFVERFTKRIQALSQSQDLLVKSEWRGIQIEELVLGQLSHFADLVGSRINVTGPNLKLNAAAAQAIGLALHELSTNASKYGALSTKAGRISIIWRLEDETFHMSWIERDGPPVSSPRQTGFGTMVISKLAEAGVSGCVKIDYQEGGFVWELDCPSANALDADYPGNH